MWSQNNWKLICWFNFSSQFSLDLWNSTKWPMLLRWEGKLSTANFCWLLLAIPLKLIETTPKHPQSWLHIPTSVLFSTLCSHKCVGAPGMTHADFAENSKRTEKWLFVFFSVGHFHDSVTVPVLARHRRWLRVRGVGDRGQQLHEPVWLPVVPEKSARSHGVHAKMNEKHFCHGNFPRLM